VLLSLGVSGDSGIPLRLGVRDGNRSDSVEAPVAIAECLALGLEGMRGIVADSKAYSRRTLGVCLERQVHLITLVPRTCAVRQALEAWGQQQAALPLLPAAISPVWLEKPERIAALAMLTVVGLLVYSIIQRQVRLYLLIHDQQLPGNKGTTAIPTAAVVLALFAQVALIQLWLGNHEVVQMYGIQPHHLLICDALGLDHSWHEAPSVQKTDQSSQNH
jgi:transposase